MHAIQKNKIKIKYHKRRYTTVITLCFNLTVTTLIFLIVCLKFPQRMKWLLVFLLNYTYTDQHLR